ncbi:hypothetical protein [uncultured Desulfobacter sp.]|uniref:hypothetical protein n=1 Tax=uncultured Desulfobacter sp. TaxID=240139 RepID=UPI002AA624A9|nr:hypothetical protein [uncultured Desulfobacter sp.]
MLVMSSGEREGGSAQALRLFARPVTGRPCLIMQHYRTRRTERLYAMWSDRRALGASADLERGGRG